MRDRMRPLFRSKVILFLRPTKERDFTICIAILLCRAAVAGAARGGRSFGFV